MRDKIKIFAGILTILAVVSLLGCQSVIKRKKKPKVYIIPALEAEWIREGKPLEFEDELWFPMDSVENLLDREVYLLGEYKGTDFFVEKMDVRPYNRLYTKFGKNKFRAYKKAGISD